MKKVEYNIEFAHIFSNEKFSYHQRYSSKLAKEFVKKVKSFTTVILIDDYLPTYSYLDIYDYLEQIKELGLPPTYIVYQTELLSLANHLISLIKPKTESIKEKIKSYKQLTLLEQKKINPISLKEDLLGKIETFVETPVLIASWYLLRLGVLVKQGIIKETKYTKPKPFVGEKVLSILPKKYQPIDETAKVIIANSPFKKELKNIENIYF